MLESYEAIYENGQLKWLKEKPPIHSGRVIVTVLEDNSPPIKPRTPPYSIAEKEKALGDEEESESSLLQVLSALPKLDEEFPDCDQNLPPLEDIEM